MQSVPNLRRVVTFEALDSDIGSIRRHVRKSSRKKKEISRYRKRYDIPEPFWKQN